MYVECNIQAFKDLVNAMSSGSGSQRRRRIHSEEVLDSVPLMNSRAGYLSRETSLYRATGSTTALSCLCICARLNFSSSRISNPIETRISWFCTQRLQEAIRNLFGSLKIHRNPFSISLISINTLLKNTVKQIFNVQFQYL